MLSKNNFCFWGEITLFPKAVSCIIPSFGDLVKFFHKNCSHKIAYLHEKNLVLYGAEQYRDSSLCQS